MFKGVLPSHSRIYLRLKKLTRSYDLEAAFRNSLLLTLAIRRSRKDVTEPTLQIQGWTEIPGPDGIPILQELSRMILEAIAREQAWLEVLY